LSFSELQPFWKEAGWPLDLFAFSHIRLRFLQDNSNGSGGCLPPLSRAALAVLVSPAKGGKCTASFDSMNHKNLSISNYGC